MKYKDLVKMLEKNGWQFNRHGGSHDIFIKDDDILAVPRHREIEERLARDIIRKKGLK